MKKLSCISIIVFLSLTLGAKPVRLKRKPVSPIVRPIKTFIPMKQEFKHLRATPLPIRNGQIDRREMVLRASLASRDVVSYLNTNQKRTMQSVIRLLKAKNTPAAQREWNSLIGSFKDSLTPIDLNELIQYVLRQSYMESNRDLQFYAAKVRHMNEQKQAIRDYLQSLREMQDGMSSKAVLEDLKNAIDAAEEKLNSIGDDAQLANINLQNAIQKQQQLIQILSNMSKVLHDTAMAVIRNMK
ncbi:MAG: hypothetical protein JXM79_18880 [Sedimentisphaerales bacterium]|nr:hypothetical protein [Sedimentisphaerales bacterium]